MNKFEMFDAINKYKDGLSHAQSKLYGTSQTDAKYYKRIGKPGSYRYFYTKEAWDAYQKELNSKNINTNASSSNASMYEELAKKAHEHNNELQRQADAGKTYAQMQAEKEAVERMKWEAEQRRLKEEAEEREKEELAKKRAEAAQKTIANREAEIKAATEREQQRIKEREELAQKRKEFGDQQRAAREKEIQEAYQREQQRRKEAQDKINDYWLNDATSPLRQAIDLHAYLDPLREEYVYLRAADRLIDEVYNDYYTTREETEVIDPETGLYKKNYEVPIEEEIKMVNPGYLYSSNTDTSITAYNENCYACTTAMVLREKGYDVIAGKDYNGISMKGKDDELGITYEQMFSGNFSSWKPLDKIVSDIESEGPGTYGDFNMKWSVGVSVELYGVEVPIPFVSADLGHSIFYKVDDNGKAHFYDCQEGKEMSISDMKELENIEFVDKTRYRYKRLDNQEIQHLEKIKSSGIIQ